MGMTELLLVVAVGGGILAVLFSTLKGAASEAETAAAGEGAASRAEAEGVSEEWAELEDAKEATLRSLEEIEEDFEAGNLSQSDYESLRGRYESEVARLDKQLGGVKAPSDATSARTERASAGQRSWVTSAVGWTAGAVAFVAIAWLVMSQALRPRVGDDSMTGSLPGQDSRSSAGVPVADVDPERLAALESMVRDEPNNVEALVELGHLYLRLQRYDELAVVTQQALVLDPENAEALTHMGMLLFSMQHAEGVMPSFDRALAVDPDFPEALQFKGMVAFMNQDYATAAEAWEHYVEVVPPDEVPPRIAAMLEAARASAGSADSL